ncbi:Clp protease [Modestobacter sp. VKM Ac-2986]|uniref:Clp protease N-terminal domain-containing protein n=1 Tax=Modestobacter sp. VKM Ac-2986 TaxID=3004140 RepID=UPI0022AABF80|nr:Clp protease N-terminal domain-containing protein [Modestobacter sp. VKM Ac-2986]MCZ2828568.1 Clp protease [Modestobacter sp. VKM Ac-2986]
MFERFTDEARLAVVRAQEEARQLDASRIEPVHLLLALTRDTGRGGTALAASGVDHATLRAALTPDALDADVLAAVGVDLAQVRATTEAVFGPGALDRGRGPVRGHLPFTDGSKRALEETLRAALQRKERRLDTGHVLLGVLAVADPTVRRVLARLGTDDDRLGAGLDSGPAA